MGGLGSGGHNRSKDSTSDYRQIDIRKWQQGKYLEGSHYFIWAWIDRKTGERRGSISGYSTPSVVRLSYMITDVDTKASKNNEYNVGIEWTSCNYGGKRAWFLCKKCGRRVAKLYLKDDFFYCRHCQGLNYFSSRQTKDGGLTSIYNKLYKAQEKLSFDYNVINIHRLMKPKGMHQKTYTSLLNKLRILNDEREKIFRAEINRRFGKV